MAPQMMKIHKVSKAFAIAIVIVTFCMIGGSFVKGEESMVNYGDQVFLQVNSLDNRWLSGGRNGGNEGVITRDHLSSDYELENAENTYKWTARSTSGDGLSDWYWQLS
jgi:hypothetical protein